MSHHFIVAGPEPVIHALQSTAFDPGVAIGPSRFVDGFMDTADGPHARERMQPIRELVCLDLSTDSDARAFFTTLQRIVARARDDTQEPVDVAVKDPRTGATLVTVDPSSDPAKLAEQLVLH